MNAELPPGWVHYFDDGGRIYFHNAELNKTQWEFPVAAPANNFTQPPPQAQPVAHDSVYDPYRYSQPQPQPQSYSGTHTNSNNNPAPNKFSPSQPVFPQSQYTHEPLASQPLQQPQQYNSGGRAPQNNQTQSGKSLHEIAALLTSQGKSHEAELLLTQVLADAQSRCGEGSPATAEFLNMLVVHYHSVGKNQLAADYAEKAWNVLRNAYGDEDKFVATAMNNYALALSALGDYRRAERIFQRALEIRKTLFGPNHSDVAQTLHNIALLYRSCKQWDLASKNFSESRRIWRELGQSTYVACSYREEGLSMRLAERFMEAYRQYYLELETLRGLPRADENLIRDAEANLAALSAYDPRNRQQPPQQPPQPQPVFAQPQQVQPQQVQPQQVQNPGYFTQQQQQQPPLQQQQQQPSLSSTYTGGPAYSSAPMRVGYGSTPSSYIGAAMSPSKMIPSSPFAGPQAQQYQSTQAPASYSSPYQQQQQNQYRSPSQQQGSWTAGWGNDGSVHV